MRFIPPQNSSSCFEVSAIFGMVKLRTFSSAQLMRTVQSRIIYSIVYGLESGHRDLCQLCSIIHISTSDVVDTRLHCFWSCLSTTDVSISPLLIYLWPQNITDIDISSIILYCTAFWPLWYFYYIGPSLLIFDISAHVYCTGASWLFWLLRFINNLTYLLTHTFHYCPHTK